MPIWACTSLMTTLMRQCVADTDEGAFTCLMPISANQQVIAGDKFVLMSIDMIQIWVIEHLLAKCLFG